MRIRSRARPSNDEAEELDTLNDLGCKFTGCLLGVIDVG